MKMIHDSEISVIVQGPLVRGNSSGLLGTEAAIERLRQDWPECEIIFSTWKLDSSISCSVDRVIENPDPGAISFNDTDLREKHNNLNRQLVSTSAGLAAATRAYAMKLRSDCVLDGSFFLRHLNGTRYNYKSKLFRRRLLTLSFCTVDGTQIPLLYHPSDIFQFGDRLDLKRLWSVPLAEEPQHTRWFESHDIPPMRWPGIHHLCRCTPEQYIWSEYLRTQHVNIDFDHTLSYSAKELIRSMELLIDGFIVADACQIGVSLPQHLVAGASQMSNVVVTNQRWKAYDLLLVSKIAFRLIVLQRKYGLQWMLRNAFNPIKVLRRLDTLTSACCVTTEAVGELKQPSSTRPSEG